MLAHTLYVWAPLLLLCLRHLIHFVLSVTASALICCHKHTHTQPLSLALSLALLLSSCYFCCHTWPCLFCFLNVFQLFVYIFCFWSFYFLFTFPFISFILHKFPIDLIPTDSSQCNRKSMQWIANNKLEDWIQIRNIY